MAKRFAPTVLLGVASAGAAAIAGHQAWVTVRALDGADPVESALADEAGRSVGDVPLAGALALVTLACWGVLLVTRGRFRRAVAVLGAAAALGVVAAWLDALLTLQDETVEAWTGAGDALATGFTGWFWIAGAAGLLALLTALAAVRLAPGWPEMGRRYDAPGSAAPTGQDAAVPPAEQSNLDLWKALDEGQDPT